MTKIEQAFIQDAEQVFSTFAWAVKPQGGYDPLDTDAFCARWARRHSTVLNQYHALLSLGAAIPPPVVAQSRSYQDWRCYGASLLDDFIVCQLAYQAGWTVAKTVDWLRSSTGLGTPAYGENCRAPSSELRTALEQLDVELSWQYSVPVLSEALHLPPERVTQVDFLQRWHRHVPPAWR